MTCSLTSPAPPPTSRSPCQGPHVISHPIFPKRQMPPHHGPYVTDPTSRGPYVIGPTSRTLCHGPYVTWALRHGPYVTGPMSRTLCHADLRHRTYVTDPLSRTLCHGPYVTWAPRHGPYVTSPVSHILRHGPLVTAPTSESPGFNSWRRWASVTWPLDQEVIVQTDLSCQNLVTFSLTTAQGASCHESLPCQSSITNIILDVEIWCNLDICYQQ